MHRMARLRDSRCRPALAMFCLALGLMQGCVQSEPLKPAGTSASPSSKGQLPFHADLQPVAANGGGNTATSQKISKSLPFRSASSARILPSGTLLTVQLARSIVNVQAGDAFAASIADPLVFEGDTLIERGTGATGRVEAAQSRRGSAYVRLTLSAITIDGNAVALRTSSLFARGSVGDLKASSGGNSSTQKTGGIRVPKGRRLTFRLTAPVTLKDSNSVVEKTRASNTGTE